LESNFFNVIILALICVNIIGSQNVVTHWMYIHIINIGLKMVW